MNRTEALEQMEALTVIFEQQMETVDTAIIPKKLVQEALDTVTACRMATDALASMAWRSPEDPPKKFEAVIIWRVDRDGNNRVEAGSLQADGWYKIYGTRTKKIKGWMPMPEPPEVEA